MPTNRDKEFDKAMRFQKKLLLPLSKLTYRELEQLNARVEIKSPKGLEHFNFAQEINKDGGGGLKVTIFHYFQPPAEKSDSLIKLLKLGGINPNDFQMLEGRYNAWFNISQNGHIEWPDTSFHEGDD